MRFPLAELIKTGRDHLFNKVTGLGFFPSPCYFESFFFLIKLNFIPFYFQSIIAKQ